MRNILFPTHYPQRFIKKHIKIRNEQIESKHNNSLAADMQEEVKEFSSCRADRIKFDTGLVS